MGKNGHLLVWPWTELYIGLVMGSAGLGKVCSGLYLFWAWMCISSSWKAETMASQPRWRAYPMAGPAYIGTTHDRSSPA